MCLNTCLLEIKPSKYKTLAGCQRKVNTCKLNVQLLASARGLSIKIVDMSYL